MYVFLRKYYLVLFIVLIFSGCATTNTNSQNAWPIEKAALSAVGGWYNTAPVRKGCMVMVNGDTLRGLIKFLPYYARMYNYMPILPEGKQTVVNIDRNRINNLRLYGDSVNGVAHFEDFVNIDDNKDFWRLIITKNGIGIYDNYFPDQTSPLGYAMILVTRGNKIVIYKPSIFHSNHVDGLIIKFINKRYHTSFNKSSFKTTNEMFNYILDKENSN